MKNIRIKSLINKIVLVSAVAVCLSGCGEATVQSDNNQSVDVSESDENQPEQAEKSAEEALAFMKSVEPADDALHANEIDFALKAVNGYVLINSNFGVSEQVKPIHTDGCEYLFLPGAAKKNELQFQFDPAYGSISIIGPEENIPVINGIPTDITPYLSDDLGNGSHILNVSFDDVYGDSIERQIYVLNGSDIPSVYITTDDPENEGRSFLEAGKDNKTSGSVSMISAEGKTIYAGRIKSMRARGNNTYMADKKAYQIKLEEKFDLLESTDKSNAKKTWLLLANARDASFVRNSAALDLATRMGLDTEEFRPVDLYFDGEYHGCHLVCEKVEVSKGRLDIFDIDKANKEANEGVDLEDLPTATATNKYGNEIQYVEGVNTPDDCHRGYLIESDVGYYYEENGWFTLSTGSQFGIKYPKYPSKEEVEYISEYMEEALQAAQNGGTNQNTGKSVWDYLDKDSLVRYYVHSEVVANPDTYASSGFFYKPEADGPLIAGPAWDYDTAYGIGEIAMAPDELRVSPGWIEWSVVVCSLPDFRSAVKDYYLNTGYELALDDHIMDYVEEVRASMKMDRIFCNRSLQAWCKQETYDQDVQYLLDYAGNRREWFKQTVSNW